MTEEEAYKKLKKIGRKTINKFGEYQKPIALQLLENSNIPTEHFGFYIDYDYHYDSTPIDTIPFATTGGDGCHFCFLTDFGQCTNLNEAPIVFISPTDYEQINPQYGNFLYAKNFLDFLRINISIYNPEIIRFKDLRKTDFNKGIEEFINEKNQTELEIISSTKKQLIDLFGILPIVNLNSYYTELYNSRNNDSFIKTKDELNIFYKKTEEPIITMPNENMELKGWFKNSNRKSRTKFYRELPNIYKFYSSQYQNTLKLIINYLDDDKYLREAKIVDFELSKKLEYNIISKHYFKIRGKNNES